MAQLIKQAQVQREEDVREKSVPLILEDSSSFTEEELKALQKQAYEQGYCAALEAEHTLLQQQKEELKQQLETVLSSIAHTLAQHRLSLRDEIAQISLLIVQHYFIERCIDPKALEAQINQLLMQLNQEQHIELCLHPQDLAALKQGAIALNTNKQVQVSSNDALTLGGCIIKTEHGVFDASIEKQIDGLKRYLLHTRQGASACTR